MPSPTKTLEKTDAKIIWERIFVRILFRMRFATRMHWVIDALDESDQPQRLVEMLQSVSTALCDIKVLLVSRQTSTLITTFDRVAGTLSLAYLALETTTRDIRLFVETEVRYMRAAPGFKTNLVNKLVARANGNFLWASLAMREVMQCNTEDDIDETLHGIPQGMEQLYLRMERTILSNTRPRDHKLGQRILTWAACSRRPLALNELAQALEPEFSLMLDLKFVINRVCGQFVIIDSGGCLAMVHETARDHIVATDSALGVNIQQGHEILMTRCFAVLERKNYQRRDMSLQPGGFFHYAWAYHLDKIAPDSDAPLLLLAKLLKGNRVLDWIMTLVQHRCLKVVVSSAKSMSLYVRRMRGRYATSNPLNHRLKELELVQLWATDLLKLVGKFGTHLTECPSSIYEQVPPFCPKNSMVYRQFEQSAPCPYSLSVKGLSNSA
jgi:hypothetical protein